MRQFAILALLLITAQAAPNVEDNLTEPETATDRFDNFFGSPTVTEPPTLTDKITAFASSVERTKNLADQLKTKLMNSETIDKETLFATSSLVAQLVEKTELLSNKVSSGRFPILLQMAAKLFGSMKNCQDLADIGFTRSGTYQLDPDGQDFGEEAINVHCNFEDNSTEIVHDQASQVTIQKCNLLSNGPGCFETPLDYQVPVSQIRALIDSSTHCEQSIKFDCFLAPLVSYGQENKGFWKSWDGERQYFFHGNYEDIESTESTQVESIHFCQCGKIFYKILTLIFLTFNVL